MLNQQSQNTLSNYDIQVSGRIDPERADWFGEMVLTIKRSEDGSITSVLSGDVPDQAALFGILNRIRDLGMKLISVKRIDPNVYQR